MLYSLVLSTSTQPDLRIAKEIHVSLCFDHGLAAPLSSTPALDTHGIVGRPHPAERPLSDRPTPGFEVNHTLSPPDHLPIDERVGSVVPLGLGDVGGKHLGTRRRLRLSLDLDLLLLVLTSEMLSSTRSGSVRVPTDGLGRSGQSEEDGGKGCQGREEHLDRVLFVMY